MSNDFVVAAAAAMVDRTAGQSSIMAAADRLTGGGPHHCERVAVLERIRMFLASTSPFHPFAHARGAVIALTGEARRTLETLHA